jgi:hypothetical protein
MIRDARIFPFNNGRRRNRERLVLEIRSISNTPPSLPWAKHTALRSATPALDDDNKHAIFRL